MTRLIFASAPESGDQAGREVGRTLRCKGPVVWLEAGLGLLAAPCTFSEASQLLRASKGMFVRHICPVERELHFGAGVAGLPVLEAAAAELLPGLDKNLSFSVQTRLLERVEGSYGPFDINKALATILQASGAVLDVRNPVQVLSVVASASAAYIGLSLATDNLSAWAGGERRFRREPHQVSRAEFKLLEAFEVFEVCLQEGARALDLGAAPGGWTRVLRQAGAKVTAVDPAALNPEISSDSGVVHKVQSAQTYLPTEDRFDIIVNDMRMDARDSARIMVEAAQCLKPDGLGIMTLKLPEAAQADIAMQAIELLSNAYSILGARQLFHNRSEVTVALRRRDHLRVRRLPHG